MTDHNANYDKYGTFDEYYADLKNQGLSDDQIIQELDESKWNKPDSKYREWRDKTEAPIEGKSTQEIYEDKMGIPSEKNIETPEQVDRAILENTPDAKEGDLPSINNTPTAEETVLPSKEELAKQKAKADEEKRKELRAAYKDDNAGYLKALKDAGISTPDRSKGYNTKSIQQAYYDGTIDKATRDYMMADSIAKFARNMGRDIGNIGAQYTGGSINNNMETSEWDKRNQTLAANAVTAEKAKQAGTEANIQRQKENIELEKANKGLSASRLMSDYKNDALAKAEQLEKDGKKSKAEILRGVAGEFALLESGSLSDVGTEEHVANAVATIAKAVASDLITEEDGNKMKSGLAGFASGMGTTVNIGIDNPLQEKVDETFNPTVDQQADKGIVRNAADAVVSGTTFNEQNVKSDIAKAVQKISKMDPKSKEYRNTMRDLSQQAGGEKNKHILYELARNGLIDKELDIPGLTFTSGKEGDYNMLMKDVNEWAKDPKFMKEHQKYMMEFSNK